MVDEIEVLVQQHAAAEQAEDAAVRVGHGQGGLGHHGALFGAALRGRGVARGHQRDAESRHQVRRQRLQCGAFEHQQAGLGAVAPGLCGLGQRARLRLHAGAPVLQAEPGRRTARERLAARVVEHEEVEAQALAFGGQMGREPLPRIGRAGAQAVGQRARIGHALRSRADLGEHLVEVALRHGQVALHLGDQQAVIGLVAPHRQRQHQQRERHQQRQQRHGQQLVAHRGGQPPRCAPG